MNFDFKNHNFVMIGKSVAKQHNNIHIFNILFILLYHTNFYFYILQILSYLIYNIWSLSLLQQSIYLKFWGAKNVFFFSMNIIVLKYCSNLILTYSMDFW